MQGASGNLVRVVVLVATIAVTIFAPFVPAQAVHAPAEVIAFERSMELLHAQMKLRTLQLLYDAGYYIPPAWVDEVHEEQRKLAEELQTANAGDFSSLEAWLTESRKIRTSEYEAMELAVAKLLKLVMKGQKIENPIQFAGHMYGNDPDYINFAGKLGAIDIAQFTREMQLKMNSWKQSQVKDALLVAKQVEEVARAHRFGEFEKAFGSLARRMYQKSIVETDSLVTQLAKLQREREYLEKCVTAIKAVNKGLEYLDMATKAPSEHVYEQVRAKVLAELNLRYELTAHELKNAEWGMDKIKAGLESAYSLYGTFKDLNNDRALRRNPHALHYAKGFAFTAGFYKYTFGVIKELDCVKGFGPLFDFVDYYGEALSTVPKVAQAVQGAVNKIDQDYRGARKLDPFSDLPSETGLWYEPPVAVHFRLPLATDHPTPTHDEAKFTLLVDKSVDPSGRIILNQQQLRDLSEALAAERIIHARGEVTRTVLDAVMSAPIESPVAPQMSGSFGSGLRKAAGISKIQVNDFMGLLGGKSVSIRRDWSHRSTEWTREKMVARAWVEIDLLANELAVRDALAEISSEAQVHWRKYKEILARHEVALPPQQILRLFAYYHSSGGKGDLLERTLKRIAAERLAKWEGLPEVGIPIVSIGEDDTIKAGATVRITAEVITRNLAPGREVDATVSWKVPWEAQPIAGQPVRLQNGRQQIAINAQVPNRIVPSLGKVTVTIGIPLSDGQKSLIYGASAVTSVVPTQPAGESVPVDEGATVVPGPTRIGPATPVPAPARPPDASAPRSAVAMDMDVSPRISDIVSFIGTGFYDVEAPSDVQIASKRSDELKSTVIEVTSAAIASLDAKKPHAGVALFLYRSQSPEGPFEEIVSTFHATGKTEVEKEPRGSARIAADTVQIIDPMVHAFGNPGVAHKPFYYQVGQVTAAGSDLILAKPTGKQVRSNIAGPGDKIVIRVLSPSVVNDQLDVKPDGDFINVRVAVSLADQYFDLWNTKVTVQAQGWNGHFWTSRVEGSAAEPRIYTDDSGTEGGIAVLRIPCRPGGNDITVLSAHEGNKASIKLTIPGMPNRKESAERSARAVRESAERQLNDLENYFNTQPQAIAKMEADAARGTGGDKLQRQMGIVQAKSNFNWNKNYVVPRAKNQMRLADAEAAWDGAAALQAIYGEIQLLAFDRDRQRELNHTSQQLCRQMVMLADAPQYMKDSAQQFLDQVPLALQRIDEGYEQSVQGVHANALRWARYSGDAAQYLRSQLARLEYYTARPSPGNLAQICEEMATDLAMLLGNRASSAHLLLQSRQHKLGAAQGAQQQQLKEQYARQPLPAWWPADVPADATVDMAAIKSELLKATPNAAAPQASPTAANAPVTPPVAGRESPSNSPSAQGGASPIANASPETAAPSPHEVNASANRPAGNNPQPDTSQNDRSAPVPAGAAGSSSGQVGAPPQPVQPEMGRPPAPDNVNPATPARDSVADARLPVPRPIDQEPQLTARPPVAQPNVAPPAPTLPPRIVRVNVPAPTDPPSITLAEQAMQVGNLKEAHRLYNEALKASSQNLRALYGRAHLKVWENDLKGALGDFTTVVRKQPDDLVARRERAVLQLAIGEHQAAWTEAQALLKLLPNDPQMLSLHGRAATLIGDVEAARRSYAAAISANPQVAAEAYTWGTHFLSRGIPAMAVGEFTAALYLDPNMTNSYYCLGGAYTQLNMKDRAIECYNRFLQYDSTSDFARHARSEIERLRR